MKSLHTLSIMTYNVHSCIGRDGRSSPFRIANVIAQYQPDLVALQELDNGRVRTGQVHQAKVIAEHLEMDFHFHPSFEIEDEQYGNAILSRYPLRLIKAGPLPTFNGRRLLEQRGAIWASVEIDGKEIHIINTHLGLDRRERMAQTVELLGEQWLSSPECCAPLILCGDFNALPLSPVYRTFKRVLRDVQRSFNGARPRGTYPSLYPIARIDHVFVGPEFSVERIEVPRTGITKIASDHLPLIVTVSIN